MASYTTSPVFRRVLALAATLLMACPFSARAFDSASGTASAASSWSPAASTVERLSTLGTGTSPPPSSPLPEPREATSLQVVPQGPVSRVHCAYIVTSGYLKSLDSSAADAAMPAPGGSAPPAERKYPDPTACPLQLPKEARVLDGPGNLVVVIDAGAYAAALKASTAARPLRLFLNGFDLGADGLIAGAERRGDKVALQFRVPNAKYSQPFWTTVYSQQGILSEAPLQASVGWNVDPVFVADDKTEGDPMYVSVTNWRWLTGAFVLTGLLVWFFIWALWGTDTFRVAPTYPWWSDARSLQTKLHRATVPMYLWPFRRRRNITVDPTDARTAGILRAYLGSFDPLQLAAYQQAAQEAIGGAVPADGASLQTAIGLALMPDWRAFRLPFSLARVQWGAWMMFATTVAVYLWLVYARFPVLDGSVLGLVAVSTLTAGASLIIESGSDKKNTSYSKGFFYDVMTDADGVQQAHRYQAIVVNLLLFAVGLLYVLQHLAYPTFDISWLELLGLSGLAQAAGKGTLEQK